MKTNWENLARIVEVTSGLAVLVTLVVLISEVRDNTSAMERQGKLESVGLLFHDSVRVPGYAQILAKVQDVDGRIPPVKELMERYGLTNSEAITLSNKNWWYFVSLDADWAYGMARDETTRAASNMLSTFPDHAIVWKYARGFLSPEFVAAVEALAAPSSTAKNPGG